MKKKLLVTASFAILASSIAFGSMPGAYAQRPATLYDNEWVCSSGQCYYNGYTSVADAESEAGFTLNYPEKFLKAYPNKSVGGVKGELVEVTLSRDDNNKVIIRKGKGKDDVSNDSTKYRNVYTKKIGNKTITIKGNGKKFYTATWTSGGYSYSVHFTNGVYQGQMIKVVKFVY